MSPDRTCLSFIQLTSVDAWACAYTADRQRSSSQLLVIGAEPSSRTAHKRFLTMTYYNSRTFTVIPMPACLRALVARSHSNIKVKRTRDYKSEVLHASFRRQYTSNLKGSGVPTRADFWSTRLSVQTVKVAMTSEHLGLNYICPSVIKSIRYLASRNKLRTLRGLCNKKTKISRFLPRKGTVTVWPNDNLQFSTSQREQQNKLLLA